MMHSTSRSTVVKSVNGEASAAKRESGESAPEFSPALVGPSAAADDGEAFRTMFNRSYHPEFSSSSLTNVGGNSTKTKTKTTVVNNYHITGGATIYCSPGDLSGFRIDPAGSAGTNAKQNLLQPETAEHTGSRESKANQSIDNGVDPFFSNNKADISVGTSQGARDGVRHVENQSSRLNECPPETHSQADGGRLPAVLEGQVSSLGE
ncbi:hypothetical protein VKT23_000436 [Stygiomarasmius scandens]|uniref:Uncharacterized protein n=1 Tax=Marasmiellus scandens TaxID=2682957 RepID=A0ABR1K427_9AGAR